MKIKRFVDLSWADKDHRIRITMELIEHLEDSGVNLMEMLALLGTNQVKFSKASKLISILLETVDVEVTQDEVWEGLTNGEGIIASDLVDVLWEIVPKFFPDSKKNLEESNKPLKNTLGEHSTK